MKTRPLSACPTTTLESILLKLGHGPELARGLCPPSVPLSRCPSLPLSFVLSYLLILYSLAALGRSPIDGSSSEASCSSSQRRRFLLCALWWFSLVSLLLPTTALSEALAGYVLSCGVLLSGHKGEAQMPSLWCPLPPASVTVSSSPSQGVLFSSNFWTITGHRGISIEKYRFWSQKTTSR